MNHVFRRACVPVFVALFLALGIATLLQPTAQAQPSSAIPGRYIVAFAPSVANPAAETDALLRAHGGTLHYRYSHALKGFAASMSDAAVNALRNNPRVASVEPDQVVQLADTGTQSPTPSWGLDRVDQHALPLSGSYSYTTNAPLKAYIIDTGIRATHADFGGRAIDGYDAVDGTLPAADCNGHGTHVAGTVGGTAYGVAKNVTLVAVRVLNCQGSGTWSGVIAGIDWVTGDHAAGVPAVANMSLGGGANSTLDAAVANSVADGVTYAVAAGNDNLNACNYSPARAASALTVGATTSADAKASFSNYGSCVDILAPGSSITSAWSSSDTATNTISGTSMASPHVAGAAALYLEANPTASPATVASAFVAAATSNVITGLPTGTPNKLLFTGPTAPPPPTVPAAPVLAASAGNALVNLSWSTPSDGGATIREYRIYRGTSAGSTVFLTSVGAVNAFQDGGLTNGTPYYYRVSAVNTVGEGAASDEVAATPQAAVTAPGAPNLTGTAGDAVANLSWTTPSNGGAAILGYRIYRGATTGSGALLASVGAVNAYGDTSAQNGVTYFYQVTAYNALTEGAFSNEVSITPQAPPAVTVPSAPLNLGAAPANGKGVQLSWLAPSSNGGSAITGYKIYRASSPTGARTQIATSTALNYKDTATTRGVTYYYEVRAVNAAGDSLASNIASASAR